jgi:hypothetical protein
MHIGNHPSPEKSSQAGKIIPVRKNHPSPEKSSQAGKIIPVRENLTFRHSGRAFGPESSVFIEQPD